MAGKTCPVGRADPTAVGDGAAQAKCTGESCAWHVAYPDGGGSCATEVIARRLQRIVDVVAMILADPDRRAPAQPKNAARAASQNPVWDDRSGR